jgi:2,3-dimethylmalate lyase
MAFLPIAKLRWMFNFTTRKRSARLRNVNFLARPTDKAARLRELLAGPKPVTAPGCYDALGARLIEEAGFDVVYMTGFGTSASLLGRPDVGLANQGEMVDNIRRIVNATSLPVIADADTGYGNAMNVIRTVQLWEQAGAAGFHLEDQVTPKKCGHMNNKQVIPADEAVGKIKAAVEARSNPNTVIIARTDARAVEGLDAAIDRAKRFADAGADILFVEALLGEGEIETVCEKLRGHTLVFNWAEGGKTPPLTYERIADLGFKLIICPISTLLSATAAMRSALAEIKVAGTPAPLVDRMLPFDDFLNFIGLPEINELEQRFAGG